MSANAEIIAELRRVLNERDEAREQLDLTKRELGRWVDLETKAVRERDEALARCETLRELADAAAYEQGLAQRRMIDAQRERDEARADAERYLADLRRCASEPYEHAKERAEAFRRGAEAMREACARMEPYAYNLDDHLMISKWRSLVRGLPIPEDK